MVRKNIYSAEKMTINTPRLAVKHLTRREPIPSNLQLTENSEKSSYISPLDPSTATHLCTFSPCLEQVQKTVTTLRTLGWLEIEMVEIQQRRIEVRRDRVGLHEEGLRGVNASAATVEEAVKRLREVEMSTRVFHENANANGSGGGNANAKSNEPRSEEALVNEEGKDEMNIDAPTPPRATTATSKQQRLDNIKEALADRRIFKEGRLVHRSEPELKTHTSYLVFAILPQEWTEEDEEACRHRWPPKAEVVKDPSKSRRQMKREAKRKAKGDERDGGIKGGPGNTLKQSTT
jgi:tRNA (adenine57-N1/adenine58-N1)-methyltransferase